MYIDNCRFSILSFSPLLSLSQFLSLSNPSLNMHSCCFLHSIYFSYDILYKTFYNVFSVYICDSCRFSLLPFILSFLPLLFLSQSLVFVAVVFIVFIILLLVCQYSASCRIVFSHDNSYLSME
jgi:hypothetical protein